jgi:hypothetical protein
LQLLKLKTFPELVECRVVPVCQERVWKTTEIPFFFVFILEV